ncbi:hypothetical protein [Leptospira alstonii]|uniref:hypothetical protein n=1 Tax=Leptospira alstonii TaxID=28452 RepID=UPI000774D3CB|nr:hypothetical protein [Leptospira alstonii]
MQSKHTTLQNAIQYYKSEKYLESEIELSRLLLEVDCDSVRIFYAFVLLKQEKELSGLFKEADFQDIRYRILYQFSNLVQNRHDFLKVEPSSSCLDPNCRLEKLERSIVFLSMIQDFNEAIPKEAETDVDLQKNKELWEKENLQIHAKSKNAYVAALFSTVLPGTGQIYSNQFAEGVTSGFVNFIMISATYAVYLVNPMSLVFYILSVSTLVFYSSNVAGAYVAANRNNNYWKYQSLDKIKKEFIGFKILEQEILYRLFFF